MLFNKVVLYFISLAKKALESTLAFFSISRSINKRLFSFLSLMSSEWSPADKTSFYF